MANIFWEEENFESGDPQYDPYLEWMNGRERRRYLSILSDGERKEAESMSMDDLSLMVHRKLGHRGYKQFLIPPPLTKAEEIIPRFIEEMKGRLIIDLDVERIGKRGIEETRAEVYIDITPSHTWQKLSLMTISEMLDTIAGSRVSGKIRNEVFRSVFSSLGGKIGCTKMDLSPFLLPTKGGDTIDLRSGEVRPRIPGDYFSVEATTRWDPSISSAMLTELIKTISGKDPQIEKFLQMVIGSTLCRGRAWSKVIFLSGGGTDTKTSLLRTIANTLGPLAVYEVYTSNGENRRGPKVTLEKSPRRVICLDGYPEEGGDWGRYLTLYPWSTLIISSPAVPYMPGEGVMVIPIERRLYEETIYDTASFLRWMVEGAKVYQREEKEGRLRSHIPPSVLGSTKTCNHPETNLSLFFAGGVKVGMEYRIEGKVLWATYREWCDMHFTSPISRDDFGKELTDRGCIIYLEGKVYYVKGVGPRTFPSE